MVGIDFAFVLPSSPSCSLTFWVFVDGLFMNEVAYVLLAFAVRWSHPDYPPETVNLAQLREAEAALNFKFPGDYQTEVLAVGLPEPNLALLSAILDREQDLHALNSLLAPGRIVEVTRGWRELGLPEQLIAFATDSNGNFFCFNAENVRDAPTEVSAVYHWDHEFGDVAYDAPSFSAFISSSLGEWSAGLNYDDF